MDLPTALAYSCDTYFYQLGDLFYGLPKTRAQPLQKWAKIFGFGVDHGRRLRAGGEGPRPDDRLAIAHVHAEDAIPCGWQVDSLWKPGDSIQLAIGQKDLLVTPLQMARFYALIANGGYLVTPHVLMDVENPNKTAVPIAAPPAPRKTGVDAAAIQVVRQGLWEGTHLSFGTSYGVFGKFPVSIAGKTGTAEKVVTLPGYTGAAEPVVVVRLRSDGQREDRRLRRDRERRPRRHCGGAGRDARCSRSSSTSRRHFAAPIHSD